MTPPHVLTDRKNVHTTEEQIARSQLIKVDQRVTMHAQMDNRREILVIAELVEMFCKKVDDGNDLVNEGMLAA